MRLWNLSWNLQPLKLHFRNSGCNFNVNLYGVTYAQTTQMIFDLYQSDRLSCILRCSYQAPGWKLSQCSSGNGDKTFEYLPEECDDTQVFGTCWVSPSPPKIVFSHWLFPNSLHVFHWNYSRCPSHSSRRCERCASRTVFSEQQFGTTIIGCSSTHLWSFWRYLPSSRKEPILYLNFYFKMFWTRVKAMCVSQ